MKLLYYLVQSLKIVSLNSETINRIKEDKNAGAYAVGFFILPIILFRVLDTVIKEWKLETIVTKVILEDIILVILSLVIIHLSARLLKSKSEFTKFFRVYGLSSLLVGMFILLMFLPYKTIIREELIVPWAKSPRVARGR